jgi:hypothetical protein
MEEALKSGGATGQPNALDVHGVSLVRIDEITPRLLTAHRCPRIVQMKAMVGFIRLLRRAQLASNWYGIGVADIVA